MYWKCIIIRSAFTASYELTLIAVTLHLLLLLLLLMVVTMMMVIFTTWLIASQTVRRHLRLCASVDCVLLFQRQTDGVDVARIGMKGCEAVRATR